jgi:hypothetical protein
MNWMSLIAPAMVAAGVSGAIAVVGFIVTTRTVRRLRADRLEFDFALSAHKFDLDKALAEIRAAADRHDHELSELKRTTELAERAIADFYQMKDIIAASRSPNGFGPRRPRKTEEENPELPLLARINHIVAEIKQISRPAKYGTHGTRR